jgi:simple sugar transport system substrate-binding protein
VWGEDVRSIRTAIAIAAIAALAGCAGPTVTPTANPTATPIATPRPTPSPTLRVYTYADLVVGFIQTGDASAWRLANTSSFRDTAAAKGIKLDIYDGAGGQLAAQIAAFHRYNADPKINVVVLAPVQSTGYDDVLKEARAAGKIVIIEDLGIVGDPGLYATHVGSDFVLQGQKAGTAMCDLLASAKTKHVAEITGPIGNQIAIDRASGFRDKASGCGIDIPAALSQPGNWAATDGKAVMAAFLKKTKDIQGVFAHNDEEAIGAIGAIKEARLRPGRDIQVVGFDATVDGFKYLISGELAADIEYNPVLAPQVYDAALRAMNGDASLPKWIPSQEGAFYASQGAAALQGFLTHSKY